MPLERIFLFLATGIFVLYFARVASAFVAFWPAGILALLLLAGVVYVLWRMIEEMRFTTSIVMRGAAETVCYGTATKLRQTDV